MPYNEPLAQRLRDILKGRNDVLEKPMFGGLSFMVRGLMTVGIIGDEIIVRVGPDGNDEALRQPHTRPMDFTGKPMAGWIYVAPAGFKTDAILRQWVERGLKFTSTLPAKPDKPAKAPKIKAHGPAAGKAKSKTKGK